MSTQLKNLLFLNFSSLSILGKILFSMGGIHLTFSIYSPLILQVWDVRKLLNLKITFIWKVTKMTLLFVHRNSYNKHSQKLTVFGKAPTLCCPWISQDRNEKCLKWLWLHFCRLFLKSTKKSALLTTVLNWINNNSWFSYFRLT